MFDLFDSPGLTVIEINIIIASLGIVLLPRIIYAALCLAFVLINIAILYLLFNADFVAASQLLIYVGAINVLIVFAIMLVNAPAVEALPNRTSGQSIAAIVLAALFALILAIILKSSLPPQLHTATQPIALIGTVMLKDYLIPFELLSILLLLALIGAITIARKPLPFQ